MGSETVIAGRILVCDPNPQAQRALRVILRRSGYRVQTVATGEEALAWAERDHPQAVISEIDLPRLGGIDLCRLLRERTQIPILVVSAVDAESVKIEALENGADDYITKPFSPGELLARLAARLRAAPAELRFEADGLVIDLAAQQVTRSGHRVYLTPTEFALLRVLVTTRGTVTHRSLATKVWGPSSAALGPRMRTHVSNLRAKLDCDVIRTETGVGYSFVRPAQIDAPSEPE
jgi:two-component system, OmpR family, KDP operon response regulator KdpE